MKKLLSLIIASAIGVGAWAPMASADFKVDADREDSVLLIKVSWDGTESETDLVRLHRLVRELPAVSQCVNGQLVARSQEMLAVPVLVTFRVKNEFVEGQPGQIELNPDDDESVPEGCRCTGPYTKIRFCIGELGFTKANLKKYDPDYKIWLKTSEKISK
ncbi:MAG: hypothetical protein LBJ95_01740 [Oscillospiraceae bacterium]|jgi:hypothetical protein|nr:hypothetical protein [Oscillospiraceae bacterium]